MEPGSLVDPKIDKGNGRGDNRSTPTPPKKKLMNVEGLSSMKMNVKMKHDLGFVRSHLELNGPVPMFNTFQLE